MSELTSDKEKEYMENVIAREQLPGHLFQGGEHGGIPISFFWVQSSPGGGPRLHRHPYEEIFVILEGHATVTIGERTLEVAGWQNAIAPAGVPDKVISSGAALLRTINNHLR